MASKRASRPVAPLRVSFEGGSSVWHCIVCLPDFELPLARRIGKVRQELCHIALAPFVAKKRHFRAVLPSNRVANCSGWIIREFKEKCELN